MLFSGLLTSLVGVRHRRARDDPRDNRVGHHLSPPLPVAPRADLHPIAAHFFRFWLWLTTGMVTKEWAAIHRKHHAKVETADDPHSPQIYGINRVLWRGVFLYVKEAYNRETLERYGHGTPDDWLERKVYTPHALWGVLLLLLSNLLVFGVISGR